MKITKENLNLENGLSKEWIITNGIGGYSSSTIIGANTRKYHGLLISALTPPARRFFILSKVDESIEIRGRKYGLYTNVGKEYISKGYEYQEEFEKDPEEAETQEEIQEEPEEEEPQEEFEEEPEEKDAQEESAESRQPDMTANSGLPIVNPEDMSRVWHFAIQAMPDEDDIELALEYLEELAERSSRAVPRSVVKITGQKLNQKGLVKSIDKLLGKTILIEDAADMNERVINEFCKIIDPTDRSLLVVFIDTPASIRHLLIDYPQLAQVVTAQFVRETYSVTELLEYARGYADREDSVFDKSGELALMERLKVIAGNQERNKKRIVEMIVNNAIEKAEKKSMRKLFQSKYDKRGCLILRDKDFEVG